MIMTENLANNLMDCLSYLAISANGGIPKNGLSDDQIEKVNQYARQKFLEITGEWEELMGEEWRIEVERGVKTMIDYEKLVEALKTIQDVCQRTNCYDCPMSHEKNSVCLIQSILPANWIIRSPKPVVKVIINK